MGNDMSKLWAIVRREYVERVRSKWFVIGTIATPLLFGGLMLIPALMVLRSRPSESSSRLLVLDATGQTMGARVARALATGDSATTPSATAVRAPEVRVLPQAALAEAESSATREVIAKRLTGYLVLDSSTVAGLGARYAGRNASSAGAVDRIRTVVRRASLEARLEAAGVTPAQADSIARSRLSLRTERIGDTGRGGSGEANMLVAIVISMLLYIAIILYGQNVLRSVLEEKTTRVAEVVVSSVKPGVLLAGKVIGVGAVGLTQMAFWLTSSAYLTSMQAPLLMRVARESAARDGTIAAPSVAMALPTISVGSLLAFLLFFLLGYTFYSSLFAAVGSMVNSEQEAQQTSAPLMAMIVLSVAFLQPALQDPSGRLATIMSLLPFSAPIMMPLRMSLTSVPAWEVGAALASVALGCVVAIWVAARVYRVGLLMYGKRPSIPELMRWVRTG
jgi:ABC-2 type transport system permease protein